MIITNYNQLFDELIIYIGLKIFVYHVASREALWNVTF